jgi:hypothetical protein
MKYKDAGKKMETELAASPSEKYYPRFNIDAEKAGKKLEKDDIIPLRARICGVHDSDYGCSYEVEVTEIGVPDVTDKAKEPRNEADRDLAKMTKR